MKFSCKIGYNIEFDRFTNLHIYLLIYCHYWPSTKSSLYDQPRNVFYEKRILKNFSKLKGKHLCQSIINATLLKETLVQVFSCEFCEIFKNTFFTEHFRTTASVIIKYFLCYNFRLTILTGENGLLLNSVQEFIEIESWPLTFFICLHNQSSSVHSIVTY